MNSAPDIILIYIFKAFLIGHRHYVSHLRPVCRKWNSLILSTPSFWQTINIYPSSEKYLRHLISSDSVIAGNGPLDEYLAKSVSADNAPGLPLDISVEWRYHILPPEMRTSIPNGYTDGPTFLTQGYFMHRIQLQRLLTTLTSWRPWFGVDHPVNKRGAYELPRWRSLHLDMGQFQNMHGTAPRIMFQSPGDTKNTCAPLLEGIRFQDVYIQGECYFMPRLRRLELYRSRLDVYPDVTRVEHFIMSGNDDHDHYPSVFSNVPWSGFRSLKRLSIMEYPGSLPPPFSHSFPKLCRVLLDRSLSLDMISSLAGQFNHKRPLESLTLNESSMDNIMDAFKSSRSFHVKILKLSSRHLGDFISGPAHLSPTRELLEEAKNRNIKVEGLDGRMKRLLLGESHAGILHAVDMPKTPSRNAEQIIRGISKTMALEPLNHHYRSWYQV